MAAYRTDMTRTVSLTLATGALYQPGSSMRLAEIEHMTFGATGAMSDAVWQVQVQRSTTAPTGGTAITPLPIQPAAQAAVLLCMSAPTTNGTVTANQFLLDVGLHVRNLLNLWLRADRCWQIPATANNGVHIMTPVGPLIAVVSQLQYTE
jgi:hypothetical protein